MLCDDHNLPEFESGPISQLLLKVASRCNIDCTYCYWFRDPSVYEKPKRMGAAVTKQFLLRLEEHLARHSLDDFLLILHGGEPLLWGIGNVNALAEDCRGISERTGTPINLAVTTNGLLIDEGWLNCFVTNEISVALSIDGPAYIHDANRRSFKGEGTHAGVMRAVDLLRSRDISVNVLSVCNPDFSPKEFFDFFAEAGIERYDIMFPDATHDDQPETIAAFYKQLFDLWLEANREKPAANIRTVVDMVMALLGGDSPTEGFGYRPMELCTVMTDGTIEAHDVLRIAGRGVTLTTFNVFDNAIEEVKGDARWKAAREASLDLCVTCRKCKYVKICGGGYLPHRFSQENGYNNPSAYCGDLYAIYSHIETALGQEIYVNQPEGERLTLNEIITDEALGANADGSQMRDGGIRI